MAKPTWCMRKKSQETWESSVGEKVMDKSPNFDLKKFSCAAFDHKCKQCNRAVPISHIQTAELRSLSSLGRGC